MSKIPKIYKHNIEITKPWSREMYKYNQEVSYSFWLNTSSLASLQMILSKQENSGNFRGQSVRLYTDGRLFFGLSNSTVNNMSVYSTSTLSINTWYHIGAVYNRADKLSLFINGIFDSSATISQFQANDFQATHIFRIGSYSDAGNSANYFLNGSISRLQIYNRVLSAQEILQIYNATKGRYGL